MCIRDRSKWFNLKNISIAAITLLGLAPVVQASPLKEDVTIEKHYQMCIRDRYGVGYRFGLQK